MAGSTSQTCMILTALALTGLMPAAGAPAAAPVEGAAERAVVRIESVLPAPVGRIAHASLFSDRLVAALRDGGVLIWTRAGTNWTYAGYVAHPMPIASLFEVGGAIHAMAGNGVYALEADSQGRWTFTPRLPVAWRSAYTLGEDGSFLFWQGTRVFEYTRPAGGDWRLTHQWSLDRHMTLDRNERGNISESVRTAARSGRALIAGTSNGKIFRAHLNDKGDIATSLVDTKHGSPIASMPYRDGLVLVSTSQGLWLMRCPELNQAPSMSESTMELAPASGGAAPALDAATEALGEVIPLFSNAVNQVVVRQRSVVFTWRTNLYQIPAESLAKFAALIAGQLPSPGDEARASGAPTPVLICYNCPETCQAFYPDGNRLVSVSAGAVDIRTVSNGVLLAESRVEAIDPGLGLLKIGDRLLAPMGRRVLAWTAGATIAPAAGSEPFGQPVVALAAMGDRLGVSEGPRVQVCEVGPQGVRAVNTLTPFGERPVEQLFGLGPLGGVALTDSGRSLAQIDAKGGLRPAISIAPTNASVFRVQSDGARVMLLGVRTLAEPDQKPRNQGWYLALAADAWQRWNGDVDAAQPLEFPGASSNYAVFASPSADYLMTSDTYRPDLVRIANREAQLLDFEGGVQSVLPLGDLALVARGLYGLMAQRTDATGRFFYLGGYSEQGVSYFKLAPDDAPGRFFALHSGGLSVGSVTTVAETAVTRPIAGAGGRRLLDGGVDIATWDYANQRGYAAPLEVREAQAGERAAPPPHGTVIVDRERKTATFPPPVRRTVELAATGYLPHAKGAFCLQDERTLLVGGGEGMNLEWWDLSDTRRGILLSRVEPSTGPPCRIRCVGKHVFVLSNIWGGGFFVYDATDTRHPRKIGALCELGERRTDFVLLDDWAVVKIRNPCGQVATVNLTDLTKPTLKQTLQLPVLDLINRDSKPAAEPKSKAQELDSTLDSLENTLQAQPASAPNLVAVDQPKQYHALAQAADLTETTRPVMALDRDRRLVFVPVSCECKKTARRLSAVFVCRVAPDGAIEVAGVYEARGPIAGAVMAGNRLCLAVSGSEGWPGPARVEVLDVSTPERITAVGGYDYVGKTNAAAGAIFANGDEVWCQFGEELVGLRLAENRLQEFARVNIASYGWGVHMEGRRLFVQHTRRGITELDLANPAAPAPVRKILAADGWGGAIDVNHGVAYVTSEGGDIVDNKIQILDVRDPLKPQLTGLVDDFPEMNGAFRLGDKLFVIASGGPALLDLAADPLQPKPVTIFKEIGGSMSHGHSIRAWRDQVVCSPVYGGKFGMLQKDGAGAFKVRQVTATEGTCFSTACDKRYLYQIRTSDPKTAFPGPVLKIWDLEAPAPVLAGSLAFPGWPEIGRVDHRDGHLWLWLDYHGDWSYPGYWDGAFSRGWLVGVDVRDPAQPRVDTWYPTGALIGGLGTTRLDGSFLYVAAYMSVALMIVDVSDAARPIQAAVWRHRGEGFYYVGDIDIDGEYGYLTTPYSVEVYRLPLSGQPPQGNLTWAE